MKPLRSLWQNVYSLGRDRRGHVRWLTIGYKTAWIARLVAWWLNRRDRGVIHWSVSGKPGCWMVTAPHDEVLRKIRALLVESV